MNKAVSSINHLPSTDIKPDVAWELISNNTNGDKLTVIDVSTPQEYKHLHLEGAVNISLLSRFFKARMDTMKKSRTYIVYCKLGGRSKVALKLMHKYGFQNVYNLTGGTLLWEEEGLPFAKGTSGAGRFSFCPFFIVFTTFKKIKKVISHVLSRISPSARQAS